MPAPIYLPQQPYPRQNMFTQLLSQMIMQGLAYKQQEKMFNKQQELQQQQRDADRKFQLQKEGWTSLSQEERTWNSTGQTNIGGAEVGGTKFKPPPIVVRPLQDDNGKTLANVVMRGPQVMNSFKPEATTFQLSDGSIVEKNDSGKWEVTFESPVGGSEWKPKTREDKLKLYEDKKRIDKKYKDKSDDGVTTKEFVDSDGNVTAVVRDKKTGKVIGKEDLGPIGRKGTTNIYDFMNQGGSPSPQPTSNNAQWSPGPGVYKINGKEIEIKTKEEYDRLRGR